MLSRFPDHCAEQTVQNRIAVLAHHCSLARFVACLTDARPCVEDDCDRTNLCYTSRGETSILADQKRENTSGKLLLAPQDHAAFAQRSAVASLG